MTQLNQIVAVEKGIKARVHKRISDLYKDLLKTGPMSGLSRVYSPKNEEGDQLPPEFTPVQLRMTEILKEFRAQYTQLLDVTLTKDEANQHAVADVVVGDQTLIQDVPVSHLLFLEKTIQEFIAFLERIPTLDPSETWVYDTSMGAYRSAETRTVRSKKIPRNHVKAESTDRHPAQVEMYFEDQMVGTWTQTKFSGAMPRDEVVEYKKRALELRDAVKMARELANTDEVNQLKEGERIFEFIFGA